METIAQEAKRLLEPIPEEKWLSNKFTDEISCCCAIGHYNRMKSANPKDFSYGNCAWKDTEDAIRNESLKFLKFDGDIAVINNGLRETYPQPTPKQRVLALLDDMIAAGY